MKSGLSVKMRTIPCIVAGLCGNRYSDSRMNGMYSSSEGDGDGMMMCIEVEGGNTKSEKEEDDGFEIESVSIQLTNSNDLTPTPHNDVNIKPVQSSTFPIRLSSNDQHNLLYSVTLPLQHTSSSAIDPIIPNKVGSVPIVVATSPSQRFAARFSSGPSELKDEQDFDFGDYPTRGDGNNRMSVNQVDPRLKSIVIVVKGRPVVRRRVVQNQGYRIDGNKSTASSSQTWLEYPTDSFESKWNCALDLSTFPKQRLNSNNHHSTLLPILIPSTNMTTNSSSSRSTPFSFVPPPVPSFVAGSKRHTLSSLAQLQANAPSIIASPLDTTRNLPSSLNLSSDERRLPSTPMSNGMQTPTGSGPSKRFFSLPTSSTPPPVVNGAGSDQTIPQRNSSLIGAAIRPVTHRVNSNSNNRNFSGRSFATREGLGAEEEEKESGILVTVTLLPLRKPKQRKDTSHTEEEIALVDSPRIDPAAEDTNQILSPPPSTKFKFPSPTPSPQPDQTNTDPFFTSLTSKSESTNKPEPAFTSPRIGLLDVFLIEIFVVNRSDQVKRFIVGVPHKKEGDLAGKEDEEIASFVALENDVRIG